MSYRYQYFTEKGVLVTETQIEATLCDRDRELEAQNMGLADKEIRRVAKGGRSKDLEAILAKLTPKQLELLAKELEG